MLNIIVVKYLLNCIVIGIISLFVVSSCIDKKYDWANLDKSGVIKIPPVPLGSLDTIYLSGLPQGERPWGVPIPDFSIVKTDTMRNLFEGNAVKNFFFEGASTVEIASDVDIYLAIKGITIDLYLSIIDRDGQRNENVVIPKQSLTTVKNQKLSIQIASQYMRYMQEAKDLQYTIVLSSDDGSVWIGKNDYIYLRDAIIKTGGFYYEL